MLILTALRLAACEALREDPVLARIVGPRAIRDSAVEPHDDDPAPTIGVYTEDAAGEAWSANNGGPPFQSAVQLVLEVTIASRALDEQGVPALAIATTSREAEAVLDQIVDRAVGVILAGEGTWPALIRREIVRRAEKIEIKRLKTDEAGIRAAFRIVSLTVEVKGDENEDPRDVPDGEFAQLPPALRAVAAAAKPGSSALETCRILAEVPAPAPDSAFTGADMTIRPGPDGVDPSPADGPTFAVRASIPLPD